ncbi:unnamed protein product [Discula destructiva]
MYCMPLLFFLAQASLTLQQPKDEYDFIIAGGGTAGLTVADRLTQAFPNRTVLVVEYGEIANSTPGLFEPPGSATDAPTFVYESQPITALNGRTVSVPLGKTLGGSSAVNGQFFDRGSRQDYDQWAAINPGSTNGIRWDWNGLLPYFQKSVTFVPPTDEEVAQFGYSWNDSAYGGSTPIYASYPPFQWPASLSSRSAWQEAGVTPRAECAGGDKTGLCWVPTSQYADTAKRSHAGIGHYSDVVASRPNYELLTSHKVVRVLAPGAGTNGSVPAVEVRSLVDNTNFTVTARLEVVLSAGAIHTPQILQRSGIGPRSLLESAGIDVLVDLPGVGYNFQDQAGPYFSVGVMNNTTPNSDMLTTDTTYLQQSIDEYNQLPAKGPYTLANGNIAVYLPLQAITPTNYSQISNALIDLLITPNGTSTAQSYLPPGADTSVVSGYVAQLALLATTLNSASQPIMEAMQSHAPPNSSGVPHIGVLLKPLSRGSVLLNPSDPDGEPVLTYGTGSNPLDLEIMATFVSMFRKVWGSPSLQALGVVETSPGPNVQSTEDIIAWLRDTMTISALHPCCTASMMGRDVGGVVATDLTVYGVTGLRVVDMSIAPLIPGTHVMATAYAIAEKASDIIISKWS